MLLFHCAQRRASAYHKLQLLVACLLMRVANTACTVLDTVQQTLNTMCLCQLLHTLSPRQDVLRFTKDLSYWLGQDFWGQGIGGEVVSVFLQYVWKAFPDTARIEALVFHYNEKSARLLTRVGFRLEGRMTKAVFKDGKFASALIFGLTQQHPHDGLAAEAS